MSLHNPETAHVPSEVNYNLDSDSRASLTADLLRNFPPQAEGQYACYALPGMGLYANLARTIELEVFDETFQNDQSYMEEQYGPYESASKFFLVVDCDASQPVGALRVIQNSENGHKTLNDIQQPPLELSLDSVLDHHAITDLDKCWDVGTLAVLKKYRGRKTDQIPSTTLYRALYTGAVDEHIEHFVTVIDKEPYQALLLFGIPFVPMMDTDYFEYMGSPGSMAAYAHVTEFVGEMTAAKEKLDSEMLALLSPYLARLMLGEGVPHKQDIRS
jgi:hypothetical protein